MLESQEEKHLFKLHGGKTHVFSRLAAGSSPREKHLAKNAFQSQDQHPHLPSTVASLTTKRRSSIGLLTFRQRAGADVGRHAAAAGVGGVVAGVDLDLVAGEVAQLGDDRGLLGVNHDHRLFVFEGLITFWDIRAVRGTQCSGEGSVCLVGYAHDGAPLS